MPAGIEKLVSESFLTQFPDLYNGNLDGFVCAQQKHGPASTTFPSTSTTVFTFVDEGSSWTFDSSPAAGTGSFEFKIGVPLIMNNFVFTANFGSSPTVNATKYDLILRKKGSSTDKIVLDLLTLDGVSSGHKFVSNSTDSFILTESDTFEIVLDTGTVTSITMSGNFLLTYNYVIKEP